jgi:hypothetical protein
VNGLLGVQAGMLKISVAQAPEKGKANRALAEILATALGVPKSRVELLAGETSSRKRFLVVGILIEELAAKLATVLRDA